MVRHTLKILRQMHTLKILQQKLQDFYMSDHFGTLCIKSLLKLTQILLKKFFLEILVIIKHLTH